MIYAASFLMIPLSLPVVIYFYHAIIHVIVLIVLYYETDLIAGRPCFIHPVVSDSDMHIYGTPFISVLCLMILIGVKDLIVIIPDLGGIGFSRLIIVVHLYIIV